MTDIFFPVDLVPTSMMFGVDDFTAVDESATTGAMQSSTLYGTRRWRLRMDFPVLTGARLARFEALVAALRGRQNRVWISPLTRLTRGSFPDVELLANNTFANGSAGWTSYNPSLAGISATDRVLRSSRINAGQAAGHQQSLTVSINTPYAVRALLYPGSGPTNFVLQASAASGNGLQGTMPAGGYGIGVWVPTSATSAAFIVYENSLTGGMAGDYFEMPWASFARCALVDNGANLTLWSDDFSNAAWVKNACTVTVNAAVAADGTTTADAIVDNATNTAHYVSQNFTCSAAAQDITVYATLENAAKPWSFLQLGTATGSCVVYANLSTGAMGTVGLGAGFLNARATMANVGGNKYRLCLTAYKTSADTAAYLLAGPATADLNNTYVGTAVAATYIWRMGVALSSTATIGAQSSSAAVTAVGQTGTLLRLKGLPVNTQGLLLQGDIVEIDLPSYSQLVKVTARLDSDAAGLGVLQFENTLKQSPADNAAIVVQQPMGRFVLAASSLGVEYTPGVFGQASLEFIEAA
jgi:hypothetical protein